MGEAEFLAELARPDRLRAAARRDEPATPTRSTTASTRSTFLDRLPLDRVVQLHFAGGEWHDGRLVDSHARPDAAGGLGPAGGGRRRGRRSRGSSWSATRTCRRSASSLDELTGRGRSGGDTGDGPSRTQRLLARLYTDPESAAPTSADPRASASSFGLTTETRRLAGFSAAEVDAVSPPRSSPSGAGRSRGCCPSRSGHSARSGSPPSSTASRFIPSPPGSTGTGRTQLRSRAFLAGLDTIERGSGRIPRPRTLRGSHPAGVDAGDGPRAILPAPIRSMREAGGPPPSAAARASPSGSGSVPAARCGRSSSQVGAAHSRCGRIN